MMEQLSHEPRPSDDDAASEIVLVLMQKRTFKLLFKNISKKYLFDITKEYLIKVNPQYSLTSWLVGGRDMLVNEMMIILNRKKINGTKFRGIFKSLVLLQMIYRKALEERYKPGGIFEKEAAQKWKHILLKTGTIKPPISPVSRLRIKRLRSPTFLVT